MNKKSSIVFDDCYECESFVLSRSYVFLRRGNAEETNPKLINHDIVTTKFSLRSF